MTTELFEPSLCLPEGNTKVGNVRTFSLPAYATCPGASAWCLKNCYAARIERIRPNCRTAYSRNLTLSLLPDTFVSLMLKSLPEDTPLVRIHVGGDFYCQDYIQAWEEICRARFLTRFWSYTRSWTLSKMLPFLERLKDLPNFQLFASCDPDMPMPPKGWRTAYINRDFRAEGLHCPHQQGRAESCLTCGYCFQDHSGDVIFTVH